MREETVLLADYFAGNLQNRVCPLFETLRQPVRGLPASRNEAPVCLLSLSLPLADSCHIAVIDKNARKNVGVELDMPRAVRQRPHDDIGEDGLDRTAADGTPGLGIEPSDLAQHVENILFLDIANLAQRREIAFRKEAKMADECLHGRIEPVALAQLDGETFGEITGANAARIKPLDKVQDAFHPIERCMEAGGYLIEGTHEIAIFVDRVDQDLPDHPACRLGGGEHQLRFQM